MVWNPKTVSNFFLVFIVCMKNAYKYWWRNNNYELYAYVQKTVCDLRLLEQVVTRVQRALSKRITDKIWLKTLAFNMNRWCYNLIRGDKFSVSNANTVANTFPPLGFMGVGVYLAQRIRSFRTDGTRTQIVYCNIARRELYAYDIIMQSIHENVRCKDYSACNTRMHVRNNLFSYNNKNNTTTRRLILLLLSTTSWSADVEGFDVREVVDHNVIIISRCTYTVSEIVIVMMLRVAARTLRNTLKKANGLLGTFERRRNRSGKWDGYCALEITHRILRRWSIAKIGFPLWC